MRIINDMQEFDQVVGQGNIVIADFYADWCGPCKALLTTLDSLSVEFEGRADVIKVNIDDQHELASRFGIRTVPTVVYFQNQKVVDKTVGLPTVGELQARVMAMEANKN
ncbi:thioredoxin family protein [Flavobacterium macacae]|uniref:Thioredoxin n=1 Tax=Flavobacterium macacae TaxID=2488993 RepID=A0A3P3W6I9_9FLAO|nr:thioredoxin family protein [Flavobacterium macacae]RRJ90782.1 thioredoxin [Flavobacterium macacae]